ncbi:anthocyanidin 3-O-glucosyltransferase 5-like [Rhodamnia argentea]|uniref:Glycosyltransferase n=1 Tax=Rhodamnia argentea TaxID=178133 RepID=A0ABM3HQ83_9MYRT|nr:anthocyanidin 3-O-glucosyltransferase 5-like [Rhodamnia argentea]
MQNTNPHAVLLASPGMGHFIPVVELGKRLAIHHGFDVTIFVVAADASITKSPLFKLPQTPNPLNLMLLPPVDISALVDLTTSVVTQLVIMMREALPLLRAAISAMKSQPTALIVDLFGTEALATAEEFDMLKYVFITSTAWFLAVTVHFPHIDEEAEHKHRVMKRPLDIPGCRSIRYEDTLDRFLDPTDRNLNSSFTRVGMEISNADGILVNTWQDLEPLTLLALENEKFLGRVVKGLVYPVGPLVRPAGRSSKSEVIDWLDMQPMESVIYISFGSGGTLSVKQTSELAWGLELSQHRFIWVVRPPVDDDVSANFFNVTNSHDGTPSYLPDGFYTRIQNRGMVVPMWAPQTEILAHQSIGGFFSHCGWNSALESMVNGVPMVAWPLYAEQQMNAAMLAEELEVAVRPKIRPNNGVIGREEVAEMVRRVMELKGNEMRDKAKELQRSANQVLMQGGSSYNSLSRVSKECELKLHHLSAKALGA